MVVVVVVFVIVDAVFIVIVVVLVVVIVIAVIALCSKSNGSNDIKDFETLRLIFSTSKYSRWKFQPCPSFYLRPNIVICSSFLKYCGNISHVYHHILKWPSSAYHEICESTECFESTKISSLFRNFGEF